MFTRIVKAVLRLPPVWPEDELPLDSRVKNPGSGWYGICWKDDDIASLDFADWEPYHREWQ